MDWQEERPEATEKPSGDLPAVSSPGATSSFRRIGRRFSGRFHRLDMYHLMLIISVVVLATVGILYWRGRRNEGAEQALSTGEEALLPIVDESDIDDRGTFLRPPDIRPEFPDTASTGREGAVPAADDRSLQEAASVQPGSPSVPDGDPERADAGMEDAACAEGSPGPSEEVVHTVSKGETLWSIAVYYYGNGNEWRKIAEANRDINPDLLTPGQKLKIPPR